jgi:hypothetical protein
MNERVPWGNRALPYSGLAMFGLGTAIRCFDLPLLAMVGGLMFAYGVAGTFLHAHLGALETGMIVIDKGE